MTEESANTPLVNETQNKFVHIPVLAKETVSMLAVKSGIYLDGTLGMGGHSRLILNAFSDSKIIGMDLDPEMLKNAKDNLKDFSDRVTFINGNFSDADKLIPQNGFKKINGALLDLGISSLHFDKAQRGFGFKNAGPLDMRLNPNNKLTAEKIVNDWPFEQLEKIIRDCGETNSRRITTAIIKAREKNRITQTTQLADIISDTVYSFGKKTHPATKTFMALRITVNSEFENIIKGINSISKLIEKEGRFAVITFHSAEDKLVKESFNSLIKTGNWKQVTHKPVKPTNYEIDVNNRSRSSQLRVIEKTI